MQNTKRHSDFDAVPEGLEFRQEYLDAALGKYRQTKRAILFKRLAFLSVALLVLISASVGYVQLSKKSSTVITADSTSTKTNGIQNTSPTIDLETGEGVINEHKPSPAVESVEATQGRFSRTTDQGDSMSSGVGLPGQLSHSQRKIAPHPIAIVPSTVQSSETIANSVQTAAVLNSDQEKTDSPQENNALQGLPPSSIAYLPLSVFTIDKGLMSGNSRIELPSRAWSIFAAIGLKLWADHGFHSRPYTPDASVAVGMGYRVNNRLTAQFQTQFNTISGIADPYVVEQRAYNAGFSATTYRYYTDRFYEFGAGLGIQAKLTGNHSVGLGWSTGYLLTADNHVETGIASTYESLQETRIAAKGYVEGFEALRHSLRFNYEYTLGKNKSIGAAYEHGLTDVTKNTYFGNTLDRNSLASLYFRMNLMP